MNPYDELEQHYPEIIAEMPERFNSHEFILKLAHRYQVLYVKALAQYVDPDSQPFKVVHGRLARILSDNFSHSVRYIGKEPSDDIFGNPGEAALWRKMK